MDKIRVESMAVKLPGLIFIAVPIQLYYAHITTGNVVGQVPRQSHIDKTNMTQLSLINVYTLQLFENDKILFFITKTMSSILSCSNGYYCKNFQKRKPQKRQIKEEDKRNANRILTDLMYWNV